MHHITSIIPKIYIRLSIDGVIYSPLAAVLVVSLTGAFSKALPAPNMAIDGTAEVIFCSANFWPVAPAEIFEQVVLSIVPPCLVGFSRGLASWSFLLDDSILSGLWDE